MSVVRAGGPLDWISFDIPGGTAPVQMHVLRDDKPTRARTLFVRFPAGWKRLETGHYEAAEEMIVMSGSLRMCGITYDVGDWGYVPAEHGRYDMSVDEETLVFARFFGPARWVTAEIHEEPPLHRSLGSAAFADLSPLGAGHASVLRMDHAWVVDSVPAGEPVAEDTELFSLGDGSWAWVPADSQLPDLAAPAFCRRFSA